ncbi:MAG: hypothetical protein K9H16_15120 [Bacteroidales bacterium]|nr:hypothetical protein [Bacteroidales bacterium]
MKKKPISRILITIIITVTPFIAFSQEPPPPPPPGHGSGGNVPGGGAPIAGGIGILLALGAVYGGKKVWDFYKTSLPE